MSEFLAEFWPIVVIGVLLAVIIYFVARFLFDFINKH